MRVMILGGGIAGLSAAIAFLQKGWDATVLERYGVVEGATIAITNRAVRALEELGILDDCMSSGLVLRADSIFTSMRDEAGRLLPPPPVLHSENSDYPVSVMLPRPQLSAILSRRVAKLGGQVRLNTTIRSFMDKDGSVECTLGDGSKEVVDLLIGADGVNSVLRHQVLPEAPAPVYTGHMALRWMLPSGPSGDAGFYAHRDGTMIVSTRMPNGDIYVASGVELSEKRHVGSAEARAMLASVFEKFRAPFLRSLMACLTDDQIVSPRPFEWLKVENPWHRGRVVLIGDAVHATTAHLASGGSMAIEDAVVVAEEVCVPDRPIAESLSRFAARRIGRTNLVVDASLDLLRLQGSPDRAKSGQIRGVATTALQSPY